MNIGKGRGKKKTKTEREARHKRLLTRGNNPSRVAGGEVGGIG